MKFGFLGALALLFIGLKLANIIAWSWWYVLLPIWGPVALSAVIVLLALIIPGVVVTKNLKKNRW